MTKISRVWYIHKNSVGFLQLQGGAEVTVCGPGVALLLRAETLPVGLHQGQWGGAPRSPHKHRVNEQGRTVLKDQLHSWVNVVESSLIDLQGTVFRPVSHCPGYERPACLGLPSQSLREVFYFNPPCNRRERMLYLFSVLFRIEYNRVSVTFWLLCYLSRVLQVCCLCLFHWTRVYDLKQPSD